MLPSHLLLGFDLVPPLGRTSRNALTAPACATPSVARFC